MTARERAVRPSGPGRLASHRVRAALLVAAGAFAATPALLLAGPAQAHNYLVSSTPAEGATLTELPDRFDITTNEALLDLGGSTGAFALQITDDAGLYYGDGCLDVSGPAMSTGAALGAPGTYTVQWQVVSADGHSVSDEYTFDWAPSGSAEESAGSEAPPVCGDDASSGSEGGATASGGSAGDSDADSAGGNTASADPGSAADAEAADADSGGASSDGLWIGAAVVAAAVAAGGALFARRRGRATER